jgi:transposase-like protein
MRIMPKWYPSDQRARATRMAVDRLGEHPSAWAAAQALGPKLGVGAETLRKWIVQAQADAGDRSDPTSEELEEIRRLKAEVRDLRKANEILKAGSRHCWLFAAAVTLLGAVGEGKLGICGLGRAGRLAHRPDPDHP